ncbi:MAG: choice-of-anchor D domain-containing protein [Alphaproteobacteria bacterium]|nr:choice-of-anchor D domain-containing protein [Alphaproteobacteria bacterium]
MRRVASLALVLAGCSEVQIVTTPKTAAPDTDTPGVALDQPDIEVEPLELRFGQRPVGCGSEPKPITIKNVGEAPLEVSEIALRGGGYQSFRLTNAQPITLQPGEKVEVGVAFEPLDLGLFDKANVRVVSNDPDEPNVKTNLKGEGGEYLQNEDLFTQESQRDVDILWVMDTSCSMEDNRNGVVNAINNFIGQFVNLGLDYQIGITTTDMSSSGTQGRLLGPVISNATPDPVKAFKDQMNDPLAQYPCANDTGTSCGADSEMGFDASHAALETHKNKVNNKDLVRSDATLAVVVLSDEDDGSTGTFGGIFASKPGEYVTWLKGLKPDPDDVSFSGMVGPDGKANPVGNACGGGLFSSRSATRAPSYHTAIKQTGGVWANICTFDVAPFLNQLAYVAAGLEFRFPLSRTPASSNPTDFTVWVNGQQVSWGEPDGYTYDANENAIQLHGPAIPEPGEEVVVTYPLPAGDCFTGDTGTP